MAKVTEQDLLDRGFRKDKRVFNCYYMEFSHLILGTIFINVYLRESEQIFQLIMLHGIISKPLTHANLKLFIDFAEGKEL